MHTPLLFRQSPLPPTPTLRQRTGHWLRALPVLVLLSLLGTGSAWAQASAYGFAASTGAPLVNMSTGTTTLVGPNNDDTASPVANIGFPFIFNGVTYTQFSANASGLIRLGSAAVSGAYDNTAAASYNNNSPAAIAPFFEDMDTGTDGKVHYKVIGTGTSQSLVIEWIVSIPRTYDFSSYYPTTARFQAQLNQVDNSIEFTYGAIPVHSVDGGATIGVFTSATDYRSVTTSTNTSSISARNDANTAAIPAGTKYRFDAPAKAYNTSTATQTSTAAVSKGSVNQGIITLAVSTKGFVGADIAVTQIVANTGATTIPANNLTNARLFYGGTSSVFSTAMQFGSDIASPSGTLTFNGSQTLTPNYPGTYYFFLAYDIAAGATTGATIDGTITGLSIDGAAVSPFTTLDPTGSRSVVAGFPAGTYTINNSAGMTTTYVAGTAGGNFKNFTDAISALNGAGGPVGTVTFNVKAGLTFTELETVASGALVAGTGRVPVITNPGGTSSSSRIIFQTDGSSATHPLLSVRTTTGASTFDAGIALAGGDWFTFDGIDIAQNTTPVAGDFLEYGYALFRGTGVATTTDNGAQNNTIKNCTITLNRSLATLGVNSVGIYGALTASGTGTTVGATITTVSSFNGTNSNNTFSNVTVSGAYIGIRLVGLVSANASLLDAGNSVGASGGNTISNFGTPAIALVSQTGVQVSNNTITNTAQLAPVLTGAVTGIAFTTGSNNSVTAFNNGISLTQTAGAAATGISNTTAGVSGNALSITGNTITITAGNATTTAYTGNTFSGVNNSGNSGTIDLSGNTVTITENNATITATAANSFTIYGVYNSGTAVTTSALNNNPVTINNNNTSATSSSTITALGGVWNAGGAGTSLAMNGNQVTYNTSATNNGNVTGEVSGVRNASAVTGSGTMNGNNFAWNRTGANTGNTTTTGIITGVINAIYNASIISGGLTISGNTWGTGTAVNISSLANTSAAYFIYNNSGAANYSNTVSNNTVQNLNRLGTGAFFGYSNNGSTSSAGTQTITNNTITAIDMSVGANGAVGTGSGAFNGIYTNTASAQIQVWTGNQITSITLGTGDFFGLNSVTSAPTSQFNNNTVSTILNYGGAGVMHGLRLPGGAAQVQGNTVDSFLPASTGIVTGITTAAAAVAGNSNTSVISGNSVSFISSGISLVSNIALTATAGVYGINATGAASSVTGNTINTISATGTNPVYGLATAAVGTVNANSISGIYSTAVASPATAGTGNVYGLYLNASATGTSNVYNHSISDVAANNGTAYGIYVFNTGSNVTNVYQNKVYGLGLTAGTTGTVYGAYVNATSATATSNLYNNLIGLNGRTVSNIAGSGSDAAFTATGANALTGIGVDGTVAGIVNLSFNTVDLEGSGGGANFGSSALYVASPSPVLSLRNNIFQNLTSGVAVAYRRSAVFTNANTPAATNNNNLYYANTPTANNLLYAEGTTTLANQQQTLAAFKTYFLGTPCSTREQQSLSTGIPFVSIDGSNAGFLHVPAGTTTQIESAGVAITASNAPFAITTDYDGQTRTSTPDIGADEGTFVPSDTNPPSITYTALTNTPSTGSRTLTVTITDASGVDISAANQPRLYFRKQNLTTPVAYTSTTGTITGSGNNVGVTFTLNQPGLAAGDVVEYYVSAQDGLGNSGTNPSGCGAATYTILPTLSGNVYVGVANCNGTAPQYAKLTDFAAAYNSGSFGISGTVNVILTDAAYTAETYPIVFNSNAYSTATNNIVIKPCTGVTPVFSGASAGSALIKFNGASYITLDGSNAGTASRDWTLTNTGTTASTTAIWIASTGAGAGSTNITVKNLNLATGSNTVTTYGINVAGTTIGSNGADNDNITLQGNSITAAYYGIYASGTAAVAAGGLDGLNISNNLVGPATAATATNIGLTGLYVNNTVSPSVAGNTVRNINTGAPVGINLTNSATASLTGNTVTGLSGTSTVGINLATIAGVTVNNNTISNITAVNTTGKGLFVGAGVTNAVVNGNTLTNFTDTGNGGFGIYGIHVATGTSTSGSVLISNNVVSGFTGNGYSALSATSHTGIYLSGTNNGVRVAFNTVNMVGNTTTTTYASPVTAALGVESGSTDLTVVNNLLVNAMGSTSTGTPKSYSFFSAAPASAYTTINYNNYWAPGNTGATGVIASFGGADKTTLDDPTTGLRAATGQDANSLNIDPQFVSATNLRPLSIQMNDKGTPVAGITTDITGATRNASTPDIGAYEYSPPANDAGLVSVTTNTSPFGVGNQPITVTVSSSGTAPLTSVQLQYVYTPNGGSAQAAVVETFTVALAGGTTPTPTQQVTFTTPVNVTAAGGSITVTILQSNGSADGNLANNTITRSLVPALCGNYNIGATGAYPTLDAAVAALNAAGAICPVTFTLIDATYAATTGITINQFPGSSSTNTLTIKPGTGITPTLTGSVGTGAIIKLNGADYVTIDGSNNGTTTRDLTISNTSTATTGNAVLWVAGPAVGNGATNNTIKNVNVVGQTIAAPLMGIYVGGATTISTSAAPQEANSNNTIQNNVLYKATYGIYLYGKSSTVLDQSNVVTGNSVGQSVAANGLTQEGIHADFQQGLTISRNEVQNVASASSSNIYGISLLNTRGTVVSRNSVHNIAYTGTSTPKAWGITSATTTFNTAATPSATRFDNNLVYLINSTGTSSSWNTSGINNNGGYGDMYYYNSVQLSGQLSGSTGTAGSAAFSNGNGITATAATNIDVRNNIFSIVNGTSPATSSFYAHYTTAGSYSGSTINNNDLFVTVGSGGASAAYIGRFNAADYATLAGWQTATGQDANSVSVDPQFVSTTDLHVNVNNTDLNGKATPISGITTDYDNNARSATTPDIGAYEFTPTIVDIAVTAIAGPTTPFAPGSYATSVTITNNGGPAITQFDLSYSVNGTVTGPNTITLATPLAAGASTTIALGSFNYNAGPNTVIATVTNPNGTAEVAPANLTDNTLTRVFRTALCGTYAVGTVPGAAFATLDAAVTALNQAGASCSVIFELTDATYPASPGIVVNEMAGASASVTLTIRPAAGASPTLTTTATAITLLQLNGTDYVTIDGSNNGTTTRDLTLTAANTASTNSVLLISSLGTGAGATNVTIKNLNVNGTGSRSYGITAGSTAGTGGADNDNLTITNNVVLRTFAAVYVGGTAAVSAGGADNLVFSNNIIGPATSGADNITTVGLFVANNVNASITGNTIQNVVSTTAGINGVNFIAIDGVTFSNNTISNIGGTTSTNGLALNTNVLNAVIDRNKILTVTSTSDTYGAKGIQANTASATSNLRISNNFIAGMNATSYTISNPADIVAGIVLGGTGAIGGVNVYHNSINIDGTNIAVPTFGTPASAGIYIGASAATTGSINLVNNIIVNKFVSTYSSPGRQYALYTAAPKTIFGTINNNDYWVGTAASNPQGTLAAINSTNAATLTDLRTATGQDAQSVNVDPSYTSLTDLHISRANTAFNDLGAPIAGITVDIDNDIRSTTTPDIGADEYTPFTGNVGITALVNPVAGAACIGGTRPVQVAIRNFTSTPTDFVIPVTVTVTGPGGIIQTLTGTTNRVVPANDTIRYTVGSFVVGSSGTYTFNATTSFGSDTNPANDALSPAVTVDVTVPEAITIVASPAAATSTGICAGTAVSLTASSTTGYTYTWSATPSGTITTSGTNGETATANPTQTTTYTVTGTGGGCNITASITIVVNPLPAAPVITPPTPTICKGSSQTLTAFSSVPSGPAQQAVLGTETNVNSSTTTASYGPAPYGNYYGGNREQSLITAAELTAAGLTAGSVINSLSFDVASVASAGVHNNFRIYLGNTSVTSLTAFQTGLTQVYGPTNYQPVAGANTHNFTTNFVWDGTSNVIVETNFYNSGFGTSAQTNYSATSYVSTILDRDDSNPAIITSTNVRFSYSARPNIVFGFSPGASYVWSFVSGDNTSLPTPATTNSITVMPNVTSVYQVQATSPSGCPSPVSTVTVTVSESTTWTGATSTAWTTASNWTNCVPSATIDAIIPNGATRQPTLSGTTAGATRNLSVGTTGTGTAAVLTLSGASTVLNIMGNLTTTATTSVDAGVNTTVNFSGTAMQSIGAAKFGNLTISGSGATAKQLGGNVEIGGTLNLAGGMLDTNGNLLTLLTQNGAISGADASHYVITNGSTGRLAISAIGATGRTGAISFPIGTTTTYNPAIVTNTGTNDRFSVTVKDGISLQGNGTSTTSHVVNKTWDVTEGTAGGSNVTLGLQWSITDQATGFDNGNATIVHYENNAWNAQCYTCYTAATGPVNGLYTLTRSNITTFSPFAIQDNTKPLPVELTRFEAVRNGGNAILNWNTASEKNNAGFEVQVSTDGRSFRKLQFVEPASASSATPRNYVYNDLEAGKTGLRYYRLRQVDLDGAASFSPVRTVDFGKLEGTSLTAMPNPFSSQLLLNVQTRTASAASMLTVTDATGRTILTQKLALPAGQSQVTVNDLESLPTGMYLLHLTLDGQMQHVKVVKK